MKNFIEFPQPDAFGSVAGASLAIRASDVVSFSSYSYQDTSGKEKLGVMILLSGVSAEMTAYVVDATYMAVRTALKEALAQDQISKSEANVHVFLDLVDAANEALEKYGPELKAFFNARG